MYKDLWEFSQNLAPAKSFAILKARKIYTREILYQQIFQLFSVKNNNKNNSKEINVEIVKN